jgi:hypothetical protein
MEPRRATKRRLRIEALEERIALAHAPVPDFVQPPTPPGLVNISGLPAEPPNVSHSRVAIQFMDQNGDLVSVAQGEEEGLQPWRATIQASEVFIPTGQPGVFGVVITGTGRGNLFGNLTFSATETIDFVSSPGTAVVTDGEFVITASDGSQLFATYTGTGVPDPNNPGFFIGEATATITGGTGRFECASGTVPFSLYIDAANLTETITFDSDAALIGENCP